MMPREKKKEKKKKENDLSNKSLVERARQSIAA